MNQATVESVSYLPLLQTLVGGVLAFGGGFLANLLIKRSERNAEVRNLTSAFSGEISALLAIVDRRKYIEGLEENLKDIKSSPGAIVNPYSFSVSYNYFEVYEKNVGNIGLLPAPLPEKLVMFYTLVHSALEDFKDLSKPSFFSSIARPTEFLEELYGICVEARQLGKEIQGLTKATKT